MILISHILNRRIHFENLNSRSNTFRSYLNKILPVGLDLFHKKKLVGLSTSNKFRNIGYAIYNKTCSNIIKNYNFLFRINKLDTLNSKLPDGIGDVFAEKLKNKMSPACVMQSINPKLPNEFINENKIENESSLSSNNKGVNNHGVNNTIMKTNHEIDSNHGLNVNFHALNTHLIKKEEPSQSSTKYSLGESENSVKESLACEDVRLPRYWYYPQPKAPNCDNSLDFKSFQVMTFNTLAQSLVDYKYIENDQTTMSWAKRRHEIYNVIHESNCDVICLQEIDELDYINFFKEKVEQLGYESVYKRKLQNRLDGVLTLYKKDRYEFVMKRELNFSSDHEEYDKPQVALIVVLRDLYTTANPRSHSSSSTSSGKTNNVASRSTVGVKGSVDDLLIITNTHLIFNKSRGDIKLYQLCSLISGLKKIYDELVSSRFNKALETADKSTNKDASTNTAASSNDSTSSDSFNPEANDNRACSENLLPNVLLCGDLNITPQSLMYNFLFHGFAPLKHTNPRCISGQYLMFDKTYLTSSSGHNESGETMGSIRHYVSDVYGPEEAFDVSQDHGSGTESSVHSFEKGREGFNNTSAAGYTNWYHGVFKQVDRSYFSKKPDHVKSDQVAEFLELINNTRATQNEYAGLADALENKLKGLSESNCTENGHDTDSHDNGTGSNNVNATNHDSGNGFTGLIGDADISGGTVGGGGGVDNGGNSTSSDHAAVTRSSTGNTASHDGVDDVIYCPIKLSSAYSVDDDFNCEPAFTAFHGWQKGCVDYICYNPDHTLLQGIYEMPLYTQVRQNGDLPHKKWPVSDHFSLISQFKRIK